VPGFLDRSRTVAKPGFCRWLVPPAALAVHLSIGQAYSLSVFNLPMTSLLGIDHAAADDWSMSATIWMFNLAFCCLGLSAALFGTWVERSGPRKTMTASACCFAGGFFVAALGVHWHLLPLLYIGYGVLGGIGLGLGYISPVSTLLKWFPDRPGMATGLAIMGFGGGAMVGSPLAMVCMDHFRTPMSMGVAETFAVMGAIYGCLMLFGAWIVRLPPAPAAPANAANPLPAAPGLTASEAVRTKAFWLLWVVLFANVTAGIGILGQASPMIQDMFGASPQAAAGFVGLISLFNLVGRFFWSSLSDRLGRKRTYAIYLGAGMGLYGLLPMTGPLGAEWLFVLAACVILSMYGGGFATVPAYLRDLFGTRQVGAIHGRLLTAWSLAAIVGPSLVTYARDYQLAAGVPKSEVYAATLYGLVALLAVGFLCNLGVPTGGLQASVGRASGTRTGHTAAAAAMPLPWGRLLVTWAVVLVPLGWGVTQTASKAMLLFR
jgi:MFS family permease